MALAGWILTKNSFLAIVLGALGLAWYGRDAYYQIKTLWQEKHYKPRTDAKSGPTTTAPEDDKVTITNLSDAKEVDFTKE